MTIKPDKKLREILNNINVGNFKRGDIALRMEIGDEGIDQAIAQIRKAGFIHKNEVVLDEGKIWAIFSLVKGCKPNKEDCSFKMCRSWAGCERLAHAIAQTKDIIKVKGGVR